MRANRSSSVVCNVLDGDFTASEPDETWVADSARVPTQEGWLFPAVAADRRRGDRSLGSGESVRERPVPVGAEAARDGGEHERGGPALGRRRDREYVRAEESGTGSPRETRRRHRSSSASRRFTTASGGTRPRSTRPRTSSSGRRTRTPANSPATFRGEYQNVNANWEGEAPAEPPITARSPASPPRRREPRRGPSTTR